MRLDDRFAGEQCYTCWVCIPDEDDRVRHNSWHNEREEFERRIADELSLED